MKKLKVSTQLPPGNYKFLVSVDTGDTKSLELTQILETSLEVHDGGSNGKDVGLTLISALANGNYSEESRKEHERMMIQSFIATKVISLMIGKQKVDPTEIFDIKFSKIEAGKEQQPKT